MLALLAYLLYIWTMALINRCKLSTNKSDADEMMKNAIKIFDIDGKFE